MTYTGKVLEVNKKKEKKDKWATYSLEKLSEDEAGWGTLSPCERWESDIYHYTQENLKAEEVADEDL